MHFEEGLPPQACVIIDMSETGAQLEVPAEVAVPGEFVLLIGGNSHVQRLCKLVWRTDKRVGVEFRVAVKPSARSVDPPPNAGRAAKVRAP
jgi:hypothetical protein